MGKLAIDNNLLNSFKAFAGSHFLLNVVNAIQSDLLLNRNKDAFAMLQAYNKLNKHALRSSNGNFVPYLDEIKFLNVYLEMEHQRFTGNFSKSVTVKNMESEDLIPSLVFQSLIENAVLLSLEENKTKCRFELNNEANNIQLLIKLDQKKFNPYHAKVKSKTQLAEKRLQLLSENDLLSFDLKWDEECFMKLSMQIHEM